MVRLYARALKGSRASGPKPNRRGRNVSLLAAISVKKVLTSVNLIGSIDGITFEAFIIRKLVSVLWKGACVLMDNYGIHKGEEIEKAIKKAGASLIFLLPTLLTSPRFKIFGLRLKAFSVLWARELIKDYPKQ